MKSDNGKTEVDIVYNADGFADYNYCEVMKSVINCNIRKFL